MKTPKVGDLFTVPDNKYFVSYWRGQMGVVKGVRLTSHGLELTVTRLSDGQTNTALQRTAEKFIWGQGDA